ncbi:MAG: PKD domain-containing protein [Colwellia sp.]|nr:PKD domain-containing protein [Colwellia sp.]
MAVSASFTAVPQTGLVPPSDTVVFTDTSTGSPTNWLWDFGDGEVSSEQNPTHTFTGAITDSFTVTLKAWIFGSKTSQSLTVTRHEKTQGPGGWVTWEGFKAASWTGVGGSITRVYVAGEPGITYAARKIAFSFDPAQESPPVVYIAEAVYDDQWAGSASTIATYGGQLDIDSSVEGNINAAIDGFSTLGVATPVADITGLGSATYTFDFGDVDPKPISGKGGFTCDITIQKYEVASADDYDVTSEEIIFGIPPVAAFTSDPSSGATPLTVQFTNTSTPAVGETTTYSWKSRVSGSGDAFVEFSTEENPSKIFTK